MPNGTTTAVQQRSEPLPVSYTHLRAHETEADLVCRLLLKITAGLLQICWLNSTHEVGTGLTATWYKFTKYVHSFTYSLQVTIKTNLLAELKHQAPNSISNSSDRELRITRYLLRSTYLPATTDHFASTTVTGGWIVTTVPLWSYH